MTGNNKKVSDAQLSGKVSAENSLLNFSNGMQSNQGNSASNFNKTKSSWLQSGSQVYTGELLSEHNSNYNKYQNITNHHGLGDMSQNEQSNRSFERQHEQVFSNNRQTFTSDVQKRNSQAGRKIG